MAAGAGASAALDAAIAQYCCGITPTPPAANWGASFMGLATGNCTASTKAIATGVEWLAASDTNYVRVTGGTGGTSSSSWTIAAYSNGVGVLFNNFAQITEPAVAGTAQVLGSICFFSAITAGTMTVFSDLGVTQNVNIGIQVILLATTGVVFTTY